MTIPVVRPGERDEVVERSGVGEREMNLVTDHRLPQGRVGLLPAVQRVVRHAGRADATGVEQVTHPPHDHRIGDHRVGLVDLVQRDPVQAQPAGTGRPRLDHDRERRDREDLAGHHDVGPLVDRCPDW
jgi:hypothetical protein